MAAATWFWARPMYDSGGCVSMERVSKDIDRIRRSIYFKMNLRAATSTEFVDLRWKSASIPSHDLQFWYLYHTSDFSILNVVASGQRFDKSEIHDVF